MAEGRSALITGGAGFIGSHLAERLLADDWEVFALDDLSTGSERNVAHLRGRRDFHLIVDSVLKSSVVNEFVQRVLVASTSEVYGDRREPEPLVEDGKRMYGPTTSRRWAYAESKALDE